MPTFPQAALGALTSKLLEGLSPGVVLGSLLLIINVEHISHFVLVFLLLTLSR